MANTKKKADALRLSNEQIEKLIELFQGESDLWNVSSPNYLKKDMRQKALNSMKDKMMASFEGLVCTANQIQIKLTYLRGYYSKELAKVNKSKKSGAGTDDIYISQWAHFRSLDAFFKSQISPRATQSNLESNTSKIEDESFEEIDETSSQCSENSTEDIRPMSKRKKQSGPEAVMSQAMSYLQDMRKRSEARADPPVPMDEETHYGNYIAEALRKMDERTKSFVKLKFQTILHEAKFGITATSYVPVTSTGYGSDYSVAG